MRGGRSPNVPLAGACPGTQGFRRQLNQDMAVRGEVLQGWERASPPGISNTVSGVIHNRGRQARRRSPPEVVNNLVAAQIVPSEPLAAARTQTGVSNPTRVQARPLTPPTASGPIAERTLPHEGRCIRSRPSRKPGPACRRSKAMKPWNELTHFAALDWADDHHDLVVVDAKGQIALELTFSHTAEGWQQAQAAWPLGLVCRSLSKPAPVRRSINSCNAVMRSIRSCPKPPRATASASAPAAGRTTGTTPGAWVTRYAPTAGNGARSRLWTR